MARHRPRKGGKEEYCYTEMKWRPAQEYCRCNGEHEDPTASWSSSCCRLASWSDGESPESHCLGPGIHLRSLGDHTGQALTETQRQSPCQTRLEIVLRRMTPCTGTRSIREASEPDQAPPLTAVAGSDLPPRSCVLSTGKTAVLAMLRYHSVQRGLLRPLGLVRRPPPRW